MAQKSWSIKDGEHSTANPSCRLHYHDADIVSNWIYEYCWPSSYFHLSKRLLNRIFILAARGVMQPPGSIQQQQNRTQSNSIALQP